VVEAGLEARGDNEAVYGTDTASENYRGSVEIFSDYLAQCFESAGLIGSTNASP
jgi:hypothetical protein